MSSLAATVALAACSAAATDGRLLLDANLTMLLNFLPHYNHAWTTHSDRPNSFFLSMDLVVMVVLLLAFFLLVVVFFY